MSRSFVDTDLVPAMILALEGITVTGGSNQNVARVERADDYYRDTTELPWIGIDTGLPRRSRDGAQWIVNRDFRLLAVLPADREGNRTSDEMLSDFEHDIIRTLAALEEDSTNAIYRATLEGVVSRPLTEVDPDGGELGFEAELTYAWRETRSTGLNTET